MIDKAYTKTGRSCRVTFTLRPDHNAESARLVGEFNDWEPDARPMRRRKDGSFTTTVSLKPGHQYRFRYLLDDGRWANDDAADAYVPNAFGSDDSVVEV